MFKKNHYIPKYYLTQFADLDGFLYVYDKASQYKKIQKKHPNNICFEMDRYVLFPNKGEEIVSIEKDYLSGYDNTHSITFKAIENSTFTDKLLPLNIVDLEEFVALTYLRGPASDKYFLDVLQNESLSDFSLVAKTEDGKVVKRSEINKDIFSDGNSVKSLRFLHYDRILTNVDYFKTDQEWRISYYEEPNYFLTSDNPLIFQTKNINSSNLRESVIFPLSYSKTALRIKKKKNNPELHSQTDQNMIIIESAIRYVISNNASFLIRMIDEYKWRKANGIKINSREKIHQQYK